MEIEKLDLDLFRIFYIVYQAGSFSKAADLLGITQPSISYSIKKLETVLEIKLFERNGYGLVLTSEAEKLLPYIETAIMTISNGTKQICNILELKQGKVTIGIPAHIGVFMLTNILKKFNEKYPKIRIKVINKPTKDLVHLLNNNELDFIIDSSPFDVSMNHLEIFKISEEKCYFACHKNRTELLNKKIDVVDLNNFPIIVPSTTSGTMKEFSKVLKKNNLRFDFDFEITTSEMIAMMLENDMGVGLLFEKTINIYPSLRKIDLNINLPIFDVFLIYKQKHLTVTAKKMINFILENKL